MPNNSAPTSSAFSKLNQHRGSSSNALLGDLEQPQNHAAQQLDPAKIAAIQSTIHKIERVVPISTKAVSKRRTLFAWTIGASAVSANSAGFKKSGATSNVFREVSMHIDEVLQDVSDLEPNKNTFTRYLSNLQGISNHRFSPTQLDRFEGSSDEWTLIEMAARVSRVAYKDKDHPDEVRVSKIDGDKKFMTMSVEELAGSRVLVVSVRGTVTLVDWMLNFNNAPTNAARLLSGEITWHKGFLTAAEAMENSLRQGIAAFVQREGPIDSLLFSGHSAGGAVAQIFYAMSMSMGYTLCDTTSGFKTVHCITFGTPPVASVALHELGFPRTIGKFLSIVNEGDPVPQAQEEFIKRLIEVFVLEPSVRKGRYPGGIIIPKGHFRASGQTIVLRLENPDEIGDEDDEGEPVGAYTTLSSTLETMLFGDPFVHSSDLYMKRVVQLARSTSANSDLEDAEDKDLVIELQPVI